MDNNTMFAIAYLESELTELREKYILADSAGRVRINNLCSAIETALAALRSQAEREKPPVALTLEQLLNMDGMPVWYDWRASTCGYGIVDSERQCVIAKDGWRMPMDGCGDTWLAYDRPPERGA